MRRNRKMRRGVEFGSRARRNANAVRTATLRGRGRLSRAMRLHRRLQRGRRMHRFGGMHRVAFATREFGVQFDVQAERARVLTVGRGSVLGIERRPKGATGKTSVTRRDHVIVQLLTTEPKGGRGLRLEELARPAVRGGTEETAAAKHATVSSLAHSRPFATSALASSDENTASQLAPKPHERVLS
jgi:hypothetical protein